MHCLATTHCQTLPHQSFYSYHHHLMHLPHRHLCRSPCERPHGLSEGLLIADTDTDAHQHRHITIACPTTFRRSWRPSAPPLIEGCGQTTYATSHTSNNCLSRGVMAQWYHRAACHCTPAGTDPRRQPGVLSSNPQDYRI